MRGKGVSRFFSSQKALRFSKALDLLPTMKNIMTPCKNTLLLHAMRYSHQEMAMQYITAFSAANYSVRGSYSVQHIAEHYLNTHADDLHAALESGVNVPQIREEYQTYLSIYPLHVWMDNYFLTDSIHDEDQRDIKYYYSLLSCLAQNIAIEKSDTVYLKQDIVDFTLHILTNKKIFEKQLSICQQFFRGIDTRINNVTQLQSQIEGQPLNGVMLFDKHSKLKHTLSTDPAHPIIKKLFSSTKMFPYEEISEEACLIVPRWLYEAYHSLLSSKKEEHDYRTSFTYLQNHRAQYTRLTGQLISNRLLNLAFDIAAEKRINTVILDRTSGEFIQYPMVIDTTKVFVTVRPSIKKHPEPEKSFTPYSIRFKKSLLHINTALGHQSEILLSGHKLNSKEFSFLAYPSSNQLFINKPSQFEPLSTWNLPFSQTFLCQHKEESPFGGHCLVVDAQENEFVELRYDPVFFSDHERFSDRVGFVGPLQCYGWYCKESKRFHITNPHAFSEESPTHQFLNDIAIAELPAVDAKIPFFP